MIDEITERLEKVLEWCRQRELERKEDDSKLRGDYEKM